MHNASLNSDQLNYYLGVLFAEGLLELDMQKQVNDRHYEKYVKTTQKGRDVLNEISCSIEVVHSIFSPNTVGTAQSAT